mgnify:FL=1
MIAPLPSLNAILKKHKIHPKFWPEFHGLIEGNQRPGKELRTRLECVANYKAALNEAMDELSKPLGRKFASAPSHYESLTPEEIVHGTSGGCAV